MEQHFAICVIFPSVKPEHIVSAVSKHKTAIIDIEKYNGETNYQTILDEYDTKAPDMHLRLLFILNNGQSIICDKQKLAPTLDSIHYLSMTN